MNVSFIILMVLVGIIVLLGLVLFIRSIPEIIRYIKMSSM